MNTHLQPVIAIVGPTAVGKTALSIQLAHHLQTEIVSADSRLVYTGMDIGTAKPTLDERQGIAHHLIDIIQPDQEYSLAVYQQQAYSAIAAIHAQAKTPLIVGGTGQYLAALLEGWQIPQVEPQPEIRTKWQAYANKYGAQALHQELATIDPEAAGQIETNNVRRVIRGLEVWQVTGQKISVLQQRKPPPYNILTLYLDRERTTLNERIDQRIEAMIKDGLIAEVFRLIAQGYYWNLPAMSGLGYAEWQPLWTGEATATECITALKFNTYRFARKQGAWFRRLPNLHMLAADQPQLLEQTLNVVEQFAPETQ